jgi:hypothetical protein
MKKKQQREEVIIDRSLKSLSFPVVKEVKAKE